MTRDAVSISRDEQGTYYWAKPSGQPQRSLIKMYIPEEMPLDGARTTYGNKVFAYNASDGVWTEQGSHD